MVDLVFVFVFFIEEVVNFYFDEVMGEKVFKMEFKKCQKQCQKEVEKVKKVVVVFFKVLFGKFKNVVGQEEVDFNFNQYYEIWMCYVNECM